MATVLAWKELSVDDIQELESTLTIAEIKELLRTKFHVNYKDERKNQIMTDFHFYNYAFCKESAFSAKQTSTCMTMFSNLFRKDISSPGHANSMKESFAYFESLLLRHSVERPPNSSQIFDKAQSIAIMDHAFDCYFRQFRLYQYIFGSVLRLSLTQVLANEVEAPMIPGSLNSAICCIRHEQPQHVLPSSTL